MRKDHEAKHRADIDKAPEGAIVTTITKKRGPDQFKTVWFKETHVKHVPIMQHMPVYTHVIKGVPVPVPAEPPPPVPPPPPPPPPPKMAQLKPPKRPMIKTIPVYKTIRVKTYKHVLAEEGESEKDLQWEEMREKWAMEQGMMGKGRGEGLGMYNSGASYAVGKSDEDLGQRVSGRKWDEIGGNSKLPSHRYARRRK